MTLVDGVKDLVGGNVQLARLTQRQTLAVDAELGHPHIPSHVLAPKVLHRHTVHARLPVLHHKDAFFHLCGRQLLVGRLDLGGLELSQGLFLKGLPVPLQRSRCLGVVLHRHNHR